MALRGNSKIEVRKATETQAPRLARILAAAFQDNADLSWCIVAADERRRLLPGLFEVALRTYLPYREVYTTDELDALAVWLPPGVDVDEDAMVADLTEAIPEQHLARFFELMGLFEEQHPSEPHYYLPALGTEPTRQSQGIGSALMQPVLAACDRDRIGAYLVATTERSSKLYRRHGFEIAGEIRLPDGPTLWPMWREPWGRPRPHRDPTGSP